jgi:hypothetical protein
MLLFTSRQGPADTLSEGYQRHVRVRSTPPRSGFVLSYADQFALLLLCACAGRSKRRRCLTSRTSAISSRSAGYTRIRRRGQSHLPNWTDRDLRLTNADCVPALLAALCHRSTCTPILATSACCPKRRSCFSRSHPLRLARPDPRAPTLQDRHRLRPSGIARVSPPQRRPPSFCGSRARPLFPSLGIFRLTDPPGLQLIMSCTRSETFHPHPDVKGGIYTVRRAPSSRHGPPSLTVRSGRNAQGGFGTKDRGYGHVRMREGQGVEVVDLRR